MSANNVTYLVENSEDSACSIFKQFVNNQIKWNATKCRILLSTNEKVVMKVDPDKIENSESEKLSGVTIDSHSIDSH